MAVPFSSEFTEVGPVGDETAKHARIIAPPVVVVVVVVEHNRDTISTLSDTINSARGQSISETRLSCPPFLSRHHGPVALSSSSSISNAGVTVWACPRTLKRHTHTSSLSPSPVSLVPPKAVSEIASAFLSYPTVSTRTDAQRQEAPLVALA